MNAKKISRIHFSSIDSTNSWGKENLHLLQRDTITVITADSQSQGRGRMSRSWISPGGKNLLATFCFFLPEKQQCLVNTSQVLSISACKTLEGLGFHPKLKWPNDLLLSGKKAAGILCERVDMEDGVCMLAGIGLNVNMPEEFLRQIDQPATSLLTEKGKETAIEEVLKDLCSNFQRDLGLLLEKGFSPFLIDYSARLVHTPNESMRFHEKGSLREGAFHSLNEDGSLNLLLPSGELRKYYSVDFA